MSNANCFIIEGKGGETIDAPCEAMDNSSRFPSQPVNLSQSVPEELPDFTTKGLVIFLYVSVILVAVGGNAIVCYIVLCFHRVKTVTSYFIVNLACSDMLMASLCIPFTFVSNLILKHWPFGIIMCPLVSYFQVVSVFVSAYTMVAISIDRYVAIIYPFHPRLSNRHAVLMIIGVWFLSLVVSLPTALTSRVVTEETQNESGPCKEDWQDPSLKYHYSLAIMVLQYFLPVAFLTLTYGRVVFVLWVKQPSNHPSSDIQNDKNKQKMVKIMIVIVALYVICWLPLHVLTLLGDQDPAVYDQPFMPTLWFSSHWLAMSNCCYSPFIYYWMSSKFKLGFKYVIRCCPCVRFDDRQRARTVWRSKMKKFPSYTRRFVLPKPFQKQYTFTNSVTTSV